MDMKKQKPTLLILAAGMGSRYGSLKQMDAFGPNGETIIDYSIYDAIRAGFGKVVFIVREEFLDKMKEAFNPKLEGKIEVDYALQSYDLSPFGISENIERAKPWGTAHAVLSAHDKINEPFCVINADDFYGSDAFEKMAEFLNQEVTDSNFSLVGYQLDNTLSEHGYVSRGVCQVDDNGNLETITERTKIYYANAAGGESKVMYEEEDEEHEINPESRVSMNFWGFTPHVFKITQELFQTFAHENKDNPKAEFFIPLVADHLVKSGQAQFKVLPTSSKWFGVTYKEDKPVVQSSINELIEKGAYPEKLF